MLYESTPVDINTSGHIEFDHVSLHSCIPPNHFFRLSGNIFKYTFYRYRRFERTLIWWRQKCQSPAHRISSWY